MVQVVEHLPSKPEALNSIPNPRKEEEGKRYFQIRNSSG
jgi:hypothetical protein